MARRCHLAGLPELRGLICSGRKRVERPDVVRVTLDVAGSLDADQRAAVEQAAETLAAHVGTPLYLARG